MVTLAVIIPYYQKEAGILRRSLTSILGQHLPPNVDVNIIVVDDASPLPARIETAELSFAPPYRLTIVEQPNGGVGAARNAGLDHVGEETTYIAFLDSDDVWEALHLERGIAALESSGADFYFSNYTWPDRLDTRFRQTGLSARNGEKTTVPEVFLYRGDFPLEILSSWPVHVSSTIIRRSTLGSVRFDLRLNVFSSSEDQMYFLECARRNPKILYDCVVGMWLDFGINIFSNKKRGELPFTISRIGNLFFHIFVWREMRFIGAEARKCNTKHIIRNLYEIFRSELAFFARTGKIHYREIYGVMRKLRQRR